MMFLNLIRKRQKEAEGIPQTIGATMIPRHASLREKCSMENDFLSFDLKRSDILIIDTFGHVCFRSLRYRDSLTCDVAISVVDVARGLESRTVESLKQLRKGEKPLVVALNKVETDADSTVKGPGTLQVFKKRCQDIIALFSDEHLHASLFYENPDPRTFVSLVLKSAMAGMGNLMSVIAKLAQSFMHEKPVLSDEFQATVMDVESDPGREMTIDVILANGRLSEGDTIVLAGRDGPFVGLVLSLLTPHPDLDMRRKNHYVRQLSIEGPTGVRIKGKNLEKATAGLPLFLVRRPSDMEPLMAKMTSMMVANIPTSEEGVCVHATTLASLDSFLRYLKYAGVPILAVKIGPVLKEDVTKASAMLEHDVQYATILALSVKVEREAQDAANAAGVKIISVNLIYHAAEEFIRHQKHCSRLKQLALSQAVFPCICKAVTSGKESFEVLVERGYLRVGTPLIARDRNNLELGVVKSMMAADGSPLSIAKAGHKVKVEVKAEKNNKLEHVWKRDRIISRVTRKSYQLCKRYCKDFSDEDFDLMLELRLASNSH